MIHNHLPRKNGLVDLKAIQVMPMHKALASIAQLKPADIFTQEELGSKFLLEEAGAKLASRWKEIATGFARSEVEDAIVAKIENLCDQAATAAGVPVITLAKDGSFEASLGELFKNIQVNPEMAEEMTAAQQKAMMEGLSVCLNIMKFLAQGQTVEAVALAQLYLTKLLEELKDLIEEFRGFKSKAIEALDGPKALNMLTGGNKRREPEARDTLTRIKRIITEIFDGSDFDKKAAIVKAVTTIVVLANDVEFINGRASLAGATFVKRALDANLTLERQYGLGFIDPKGTLLDEHFATKANISQLYATLDVASQRGFNRFLQEYTDCRLFGLQEAQQTRNAIMEAVGGLRGFATVSTLLELGFFSRPISDIVDVCRKMPLIELSTMTRDELETAVQSLPKTLSAGDAFRNARLRDTREAL